MVEEKKKQRSVILSASAMQYLRQLAQRIGVSQNDILEMAVRRMAAEELAKPDPLAEIERTE